MIKRLLSLSCRDLTDTLRIFFSIFFLLFCVSSDIGGLVLRDPFPIRVIALPASRPTSSHHVPQGRKLVAPPVPRPMRVCTLLQYKKINPTNAGSIYLSWSRNHVSCNTEKLRLINYYLCRTDFFALLLHANDVQSGSKVGGGKNDLLLSGRDNSFFCCLSLQVGYL